MTRAALPLGIFALDVTCPHCGGRPGGSCHVCLGGRRVLEFVAAQAVRSVWGRTGCCDACRRVGPQGAPAPSGRHDVAGFVGGGVTGDY